MPQEDSKLLIKGAFILTIAGTLTKILSAIYRIPFQNIVGDIGFYIYQQIYPLYGISIALATYGFPVIISKLIAEKEDRHEGIDSRQIIQTSFILLGSTGLILFLIIFFGAGFLAGRMGDPKLGPLIRIISFSFLLMPFISTIRGFFQGKGEMLPTAISQVMEQFIRVALIIGVTFVLVKRDFSLYHVGAGALIGSLIGGGVSLFIVFVFYLKHQRIGKVRSDRRTYRFVGKILFIQGLAVCISGMLLVLFQFVDSLNIFALLTKSGINLSKAKELKGVFDRGQPLIQLGTVVATSLSLTLVPIITSEFNKGNVASVHDKIRIAFKISFIVGLGATVGLINIMDPTNTMLFANTKGSAVLSVFSLSIFFSSMIVTIAGILQGVGKVLTPAVYIIMGIFLKFIGNYILIPKMGTMGASISTVVSMAIILYFLIHKLIKMKIQLVPLSFFIKAMISAVVMSAILQIWSYLFEYFHLTTRVWSVLEALGGVAIGGVLYIYMIGINKLFDDKELTIIPFGKTLSRLNHKYGGQ